MQIKIDRSDYKTRRQLDVIARRLLKARRSIAQGHIGAPAEYLSVSFRPYDLEKVVAIIKGEKVIN